MHNKDILLAKAPFKMGEIKMYQITFSFSAIERILNDIYVDSNSLYTEDIGYGFVVERNRNEQELLQIPELNAAFSPWYWDAGKELTKLVDTATGVAVEGEMLVPLTFKMKVPSHGNYHLSLIVSADSYGCEKLTIFTGRRRLAVHDMIVLPNTKTTIELIVNVCDIIPRGKETVYEDTTLDITVFGSHVSISCLKVEAVDVPTIFIAGDSTVTDQSGTYPYDPGCCFGGWGQMISAYLTSNVAVSNHAHSGLTTESFRSEGHYGIVSQNIKPGDFYLMQFGHNDQKLPELSAGVGYRNNLIRYIHEMRNRGVQPVIVTPIARNTWKADGTYNDLLAEYAAECFRIGKEYQVPVIDLHKFSMDFVKKEGLESAKRYYYPKDYTHTNDFGAYLMAGYIAFELTKLPEIKMYIKKEPMADWTPPLIVALPALPKGFEREAISKIPKENDLERPQEIIMRVEFLDYLIKVVGYVPMNVYNDMYSDVIGHEWYAGIVEVSYQNSLVNDKYTVGGMFYPTESVTWEQLVSFSANGYKSRKAAALKEDDVSLFKKIGIIEDNYQAEKVVTRLEALQALKKLEGVL